MVVAALAAASPAGAATVAVSTDFQEATLTYAGEPGETNSVTITKVDGPSGLGWLVHDHGSTGTWPALTPVTVTPGADCARIDPQTVFCEIEQTEANLLVRAWLGDRGDSANVATACGATEDELDYPCNLVSVYGEGGKDSLDGSDIRAGGGLFGGAERDFLHAGEEGTLAVGGPGPDWIEGAAGSDDFDGGGGADFIWGAAGADIVEGGDGRDELHGGSGRDTFYARDGVRDEVRGGQGLDRARVDSGDLVSSVERFF